MLKKEYVINKTETRQTRQGKSFISMVLISNDKDKISIDGKIWPEHVKKLEDKCLTGNIIQIIEGKEDSYNNIPQIIIEDIEIVGRLEWGIALDKAKEIYDKLCNFIEYNILNEQAKLITLQTLAKYSKNPIFFRAPAAKHNHHNYPGGLLQHTWELVTLARAIKETDLYPKVGWDIVYSACILHDLGKIHDYEIDENSIKTTDTIKLTGHLVTTPLEIFDTAKSLGYDYTPVFNNIMHAVVAHHGRKEWGSPQEPATKEAWIVHLVDMISSHITDN